MILLFVLLLPALARASRRLRAYVAEIRYQASHDSLTGLSNRVALHADLAAALREAADGEHVAVLLVDLDRFKEVNDSLGHDAGDELLREIAHRLVETAGAASVFRLGGDEFAIVLACDDSRQDAVELGHAAATEHRDARLDPRHPDLGRRQRRDRDRARRRNRRRPAHPPRRTSRCTRPRKRAPASLRYDAASDRNDASKLVLMTELRVAVERGELEVHYQPIVDASDRALTKVEALVRWQHPTKRDAPAGSVHPAGRAHAADRRRSTASCSREAIRQCGIWRRRGVDVGVTVNVTVLDLLERSFATDIAEHASRRRLPAVGADDRDHRGGPRPGARPRPAHARGRCARSACRWRSTTSAPATRRSAT